MLQNKYEQVMEQVAEKFEKALTPEQPLPRAVQVHRYATQHRNNPQALAEFVRRRMKAEGMADTEFDKAARDYVQAMERGLQEEWRAAQKPPRVGKG